jgi:hypothetical protein
MAKHDKKPTLDLEISLGPLRFARRQLKAIDDEELDALPPEKQREWSRALQKLSVAITKLETTDLQNLHAEFLAREPQLQAVTAQLDQDLAQLTDAVAIIAAASTAMKTVTEIVALLA